MPPRSPQLSREPHTRRHPPTQPPTSTHTRHKRTWLQLRQRVLLPQLPRLPPAQLLVGIGGGGGAALRGRRAAPRHELHLAPAQPPPRPAGQQVLPVLVLACRGQAGAHQVSSSKGDLTSQSSTVPLPCLLDRPALLAEASPPPRPHLRSCPGARRRRWARCCSSPAAAAPTGWPPRGGGTASRLAAGRWR